MKKVCWPFFYSKKHLLFVLGFFLDINKKERTGGRNVNFFIRKKNIGKNYDAYQLKFIKMLTQTKILMFFYIFLQFLRVKLKIISFLCFFLQKHKSLIIEYKFFLSFLWELIEIYYLFLVFFGLSNKKMLLRKTEDDYVL